MKLRKRKRKNIVISWNFLPEFVALSLVCLAVFLFISLISYHAYDSSLFYYNSKSSVVLNKCGVVGAYASSFLFYIFGASAYLFIGLLFFISFLILFKRNLFEEWDRLVALILLMVSSASIFSLYRVTVVPGILPGGLLGTTLYYKCFAWFDSIGSTIFFFLIFLISLIILFRFSFIKIIHYKIKAFRFLTSWDRCIVPIFRIIQKVAYGVWIPIMGSCRYFRKVFDGSVVGDVDSVTTEFNYDFELNDGIKIISKDLKMLLSRQDIHPENIRPQRNETKSNVKKGKTDPKLIFASYDQDDHDIKDRYLLPHLDIFIGLQDEKDDPEVMKDLEKRAKILEEKLERFGVYGKVISIKRGPVVTLFEYRPQIDSKISKIIALEDDLALALQALSIRIIAPIPGRSVVGLEVANKKRKDVFLAKIIQSSVFQDTSFCLPLILGEDTIGNNVVVDLAKMPHLLIAGSTGSGKSVALNAMLISLLCKCTPDELKLILIDPKRLEFASYANIAHLVFPIVTRPKKVGPVLRWVVKQMEERYEKMAECGARNIFDFRKKMQGIEDQMPFIVVVIDELSDLMMLAGKEIEDLITRIAQMARAAGIHLIVATQRPSVDVITGLIKVNFPSRISFRVTSKIDSRTIIDCAGADKLLGRGDMLFLDSGSSTLRRVHGAYVSDKEINQVVEHIKAEREVEYLELIEETNSNLEGLSDADDQLYKDVLTFLDTVDEVSISLLQRKFRIGYNRSARIIDTLEMEGLISSSEGGKTRKVVPR